MLMTNDMSLHFLVSFLFVPQKVSQIWGEKADDGQKKLEVEPNDCLSGNVKTVLLWACKTAFRQTNLSD